MILCGDIGATKSLLGLARMDTGGTLRLVLEESHFDREWPSFEDLVVHFIARAATVLNEAVRIDAAGFGIAGPVCAGTVRMTHHGWTMDAASLSTLLGGAPVALLNDCEAAAHGIDDLDATGIVSLQTGKSPAPGAQIMIGAGSSLGVALRLPGHGLRAVVRGEGGHVGFAPRSEIQVELWRHLYERVGRVSAEHVVSGPGLVRIYDWLTGNGNSGTGAEITGLTGEVVWRRAREAGDTAAIRALEIFAECYGAVAGDHALTVLAHGGVYLTGGIAPQIMSGANTKRFLSAFRDKGPHALLAATIPIHLVVDRSLPLLGAARAAWHLFEAH